MILMGPVLIVISIIHWIGIILGLGIVFLVLGIPFMYLWIHYYKRVFKKVFKKAKPTPQEIPYKPE